MAELIVMDHTGDTRHAFDPADRAAVDQAEKRFLELTGAGFTAATKSAGAEPTITRTFDPTAEQTLFYPRLIGG